MAVTNIEIAGMLGKLADLLEIAGENPFRVRAYRNAVLLIESTPQSIASMVAAGEDLSQMPGIGEALAKKLKEMVETGHLTALEKEEKQVPPALLDLLRIPGLGPKRVHLIYEQLHLTTLTELDAAAKDGRLAALPGFGDKIVTDVRRHLAAHATGDTRRLRSEVEPLIESLVAALQNHRGTRQLILAGSMRRRAETIGDVDILAASEEGTTLADRFTTHDDVAEVIAKGATKSSVVLRSGLHVDLRVVPEASFGAALHYFTGSKTHNIAVRTRGVKMGLKINEYGIFKGRKQMGGRSEGDVFAAVGLPFIEPELREGRGEIEAAEQGQLPRLLTLADIRGDLHVHTTATDGRDSLEAMAQAARDRGYLYLAIADHSQRMTMAHGLNPARLAKQIREIDKLNARLAPFRLLKSVEVDILEDGRLDLPDETLKELDLVVAAIHLKQNLASEFQTERVLRAMDNPHVSILAHPTGRLINQRAPMDLDMERIVKAAHERGCHLELNAQPTRLDVTDLHCRMAREAGAQVVISTDAHSAAELDLMRHGVDQARRGWLEAGNVLNTLPLQELLGRLKRT
jgi:DNA polymerase (family 10)